MSANKNGEKIWQWAIFCFVLAGITGFLYRLGFIYPLPFSLNLENIRHAHSHLMFFGWASLLPLSLIAIDAVPGYRSAIGARLMRMSLWLTLIFGLLSFPFFLLWGYHPVSLGGVLLPFSVILSGLVMIGWYLFIIGYLMTRFREKIFTPNIWFEAALVMLFICSLGAWGVGIAQSLNIGTPLLGKALTHFFLSVFVEGWVVLIILGVMAKALKLQDDDFVVSPNVIIGLIVFGAPLTFTYGIPESLVNITLSTSTRLGSLLLAEGILLFMYSAIKKAGYKSIWIWPIIFMVLKALMQLLAAVLPAGVWLSDHSIRIFYLHVLLLGGFTNGMVIFLSQTLKMPRIYQQFIIFAIILLLISLLLFTRLWPAFLSGMWIYSAMAIAALLPVLAVIIFWIGMRR